MHSDIIHGDCFDVLDEVRGTDVDMVYLDPPFFTGKVHRQRTRDGDTEFSFADLWSSHGEYAEFLHRRLLKVREVMSDSANVFFHCDKSGNHIARLVMDQVFGTRNFRSEVIWTYRRWSNSKRGLLPSHQTILHYSKSNSYNFYPIYESYSASTNVDQLLQQRGRDGRGKSVYARNEDGSVVAADPKRGVPLRDVWDIPYLNPKARERVGYPTQKPLVLLERIVALSTQPGDLVLDPFCGSGTTLVAAKLAGRRYLGIDRSSEAVALAKSRIDKPVKSESKLLRNGRDSYETASALALRFLEGIEHIPVQRNAGIDAILKEHVDGGPVLVRVQRPGELTSRVERLLLKAGRRKAAGALVVVVTDNAFHDVATRSTTSECTFVTSPAVDMVRHLGFSAARPTQQHMFGDSRAQSISSIVDGQDGSRNLTGMGDIVASTGSSSAS